MKVSTYNCDVCGAMCEGDGPDAVRPASSSWFYIALLPYDASKPPYGVPQVRKDVCSTACAVKFIRSCADRLEELQRREGT